jgi:hypothetical protein
MNAGVRARRGSVAGASGDAGVEYRRGVAAYAVALGLAGVPLPGLDIPPAHGQVSAVSLETDDDVDDIRVDFASGWTAFLQAKRTLRRGGALTKAVRQWVGAGKGILDPNKDRLVIVTGQMSDPMRHLQRALSRQRMAISGAPTPKEMEILQHVEGLLYELNASQRKLVLKCAAIWELSVEEIQDGDAQHAISYLQGIVATGSATDAQRAWNSLTGVAGYTARRRGGHDLSGWLAALRGEGVRMSGNGDTPAAELENLHQAMGRYYIRLSREGSQIDLRALGAQLPTIPFDNADADVKVNTSPDGDRHQSELVWAFMRRGRLVLTGLPGGGKSTSIRRLAAQLCSLPDGPMPVRVSLRDVNSLDPSMSFRDRLVSTAIRDDRASDRALLRGEIERRLDEGGIALLLDSLDETYDDRAVVVGQIDALLAEASPDVDVLLATRDIAYGYAATLGWPTLRLSAPKAIHSVVGSVLHAAAKYVAANSSEQWVAERSAWVKRVLDQDSILCETPLMPVLLSILAVERAPAALPSQRASILAAVVQDAVAKYELKREDGRTLGPLGGSSLDTAAMHAFTREATTILRHNGSVPIDTVVHEVADELAAQWGLSPGHSTVAARDAVYVFDEAGIFVISGAEQSVAARFALFAEIGDALRVASLPDDADSWVSERISAQQMEPLILAAALRAEVATALISAMERHPENMEVVHAAVRAFSEGAHFHATAIRRLCIALIDDVSTGTPRGWRSWRELLKLPIPDDLRTNAKAAARQHGPAHEHVACAALNLRFKDKATLLHDPDSLLTVLTIPNLQTESPSDPSGGYDLGSTTVDVSLTETQFSVAELLLGQVPAATRMIVDCANNAPMGLLESLLRLLRDRGFADEAREVEEAIGWTKIKWPAWMLAVKDRQTRILELLAAEEQSELNYSQRARLDDVADFVKTLDLNDGGTPCT